MSCEFENWTFSGAPGWATGKAILKKNDCLASLRKKYHEDRCFGTEGQPQPGHIFVFISASSQDSVPAVFWRVDGLAAFPQLVQENP
ncbi:hypothetical protein TNCV_338661 [Trichonephila clavipes]|nr:hypothetical protein TNCV_338661 [Trichonephila clavipes]